MRRLLVLAAVVLLAATACSSGDDGDDNAEPARITVHGSGTVRAVPDLLTVTLGVETQAPKAVTALDDNNRRAQSVLDELLTRGVSKDDVRTSQVSMNPTYDQRGRINGFQVSNLVIARLHDLDRAGELLDAVASAAGDAVRVHGFELSIEDPATAAADARADAVRRARTQAAQLAEAAGVRLGKLRSLRETPTGGPQPYYSEDRSAGASSVGSVALPVSPGSLEVRVEVDLVYDVS